MNPFAGTQGILSLFSTHPPIQERVRRLRELAAATARPELRSIHEGA